MVPKPWALTAMGTLLIAGCAFTQAKEYPIEPLPAERTIADGPFEPTWESLAAGYECPDWFRDAKLGIWAHWGAQCEPGQGDWYARSMYMQGHVDADAHRELYGHPSEFGFKDVINEWEAENWDPGALLDMYVDAGAKYFVAMATHCDNFDAFDSKYHAWNSTNIGPKRDIIGEWKQAAERRGLRFGVSNHSSHIWHWFQPAYAYDGEGPLQGVRYDAYTQSKEDGVGKWWEGLDPRDLYGKPREDKIPPDGIEGAREMRRWLDEHTLRGWPEDPPPGDPEYVMNWYCRVQDLMDKYEPDFVYLDNTGNAPLGQAGLDIVAHYYNSSLARKGGTKDVVLTLKGLRGDRIRAVTHDFERGGTREIAELPFETGTCIGQWHYDVNRYENNEYKSLGQILRMFVDVISKNGTMLLSIPIRGDGTLDDYEIQFLKDLGVWTRTNSEAIYGSRPWQTFGEGPTEIPRGNRGADGVIPYTQEDVRFTTNNGRLYAFVMELPTEAITIEALGADAEHAPTVSAVRLLGSDETLTWEQTAETLRIDRPAGFPSADVNVFAIEFQRN